MGFVFDNMALAQKKNDKARIALFKAEEKLKEANEGFLKVIAACEADIEEANREKTLAEVNLEINKQLLKRTELFGL